MEADKSAGSGFGRTKCGAKPEPQGCGEPIQRPGRQTLVYNIAQMKRLSNRQLTVHGLDTGIPAGMTAFLARQDLCITKSAEGGNHQDFLH